MKRREFIKSIFAIPVALVLTKIIPAKAKAPVKFHTDKLNVNKMPALFEPGETVATKEQCITNHYVYIDAIDSKAVEQYLLKNRNVICDNLR